MLKTAGPVGHLHSTAVENITVPEKVGQFLATVIKFSPTEIKRFVGEMFGTLFEVFGNSGLISAFPSLYAPRLY